MFSLYGSSRKKNVTMLRRAIIFYMSQKLHCSCTIVFSKEYVRKMYVQKIVWCEQSLWWDYHIVKGG